MFRLHVVFVLCGSSTHYPWECPAEEMLSQSWQPWCWGHYSVWKVHFSPVKYFFFNVMQIHSSSANTFYLFSYSQVSGVGSHALWPVSPYEDLSYYICSAHCSDPAYARNQIRGGQKEVEVEELHWFYWKLPQPRAVPLCKCGRWSLLCAHSALLLHVRWTKTLHTVKGSHCLGFLAVLGKLMAKTQMLL